MAKFEFTLGALPNFALPVKFTMPNGEEAKITFKVRHLSSADIQDLYEREGGLKDHEFITEIATGWSLKEEFNEENVMQLARYYPAAAVALTQSYIQALAGQRAKN